MIYFIIFTIGVGIFEIKNMLSKKMIREMTVWIIIAIPTLIFGIYYLKNPHAQSFCEIVFDILGIKY